MRIDLSVGAGDPTFGHDNLPSGVDQLAFRTHQRHLIVEGAKHVHLEFQGGEPLPAGSVECTAHPTAESSSVANQPPCTVPSGL